MRITQVILSKHLGGAERHVVDLSNRLATRHEVQVILRKTPRRLVGLEHSGNIASLLNPGILVQEVGDVFRNRQLRRLIQNFHPDIVHTHLGDAGKSLRAVRPDAPLIGTLHGEYKDKCYRAHDALICVSEWQMWAIPNTFTGKAVVIPNFIPKRQLPQPAETNALSARFGISPSSMVIGSVGRLAPEKGFDILLRAFEKASLENAVLLLVGDGPERANLEGMATSSVRFTGWQKDPWPFFGVFDVFVSASRYEPFGIVVLEAMHAGVPVVSTRSEGPSEILKNGAGMLIDIDDVTGLAEALKSLAASSELRMQLAKEGRAEVEKYDIDAIVPQIEAFYCQMIR